MMTSINWWRVQSEAYPLCEDVSAQVYDGAPFVGRELYQLRTTSLSHSEGIVCEVWAPARLGGRLVKTETITSPDPAVAQEWFRGVVRHLYSEITDEYEGGKLIEK